MIPHRNPEADIATFKVHLSRQTCGEGDPVWDMGLLDLGETFPNMEQLSRHHHKWACRPRVWHGSLSIQTRVWRWRHHGCKLRTNCGSARNLGITYGYFFPSTQISITFWAIFTTYEPSQKQLTTGVWIDNRARKPRPQKWWRVEPERDPFSCTGANVFWMDQRQPNFFWVWPQQIHGAQLNSQLFLPFS